MIDIRRNVMARPCAISSTVTLKCGSHRLVELLQWLDDTPNGNQNALRNVVMTVAACS
jgi:hypothetical protein